MSGNWNGSELEGLGFNLCVAPPHIIMSLISRDRSRVRDRRSEVGDDFVVKTKVGQGQQGKIPSCEARRGLKRIMLREDCFGTCKTIGVKEVHLITNDLAVRQR